MIQLLQFQLYQDSKKQPEKIPIYRAMISTATYQPQFPLPAMGGYRYFFNGQEADNEVYGNGAVLGYEFRQYDTRIGRWWSVDPKSGTTPSISVFAALNNNPIVYADPDGRKEFVTIKIQMNTGQTIVLRKQVSNRIMTDGIQHMKVSSISNATWHYENYYYDYEHVYNFTQNQKGDFSLSENVTKIIPSSPVRNTEIVWFGGDKYGDTKKDPKGLSSYYDLNQAGGWHLVSENGGVSPTQYIATKESPTMINVNLLLDAFNGAGGMRGPLPNMKNNPLDKAAFTNIVKDIIQTVVEQTKMEYENEKVMVDFTVDDGSGKYHQGSQSNVSRKDSASTAKKLSNAK